MAIGARVVWWRLPAVSFERNHEGVALGENYDVWGNWHPDEIAVPGFGRNATIPSEGTGRPMGD